MKPAFQSGIRLLELLVKQIFQWLIIERSHFRLNVLSSMCSLIPEPRCICKLSACLPRIHSFNEVMDFLECLTWKNKAWLCVPPDFNVALWVDATKLLHRSWCLHKTITSELPTTFETGEIGRTNSGNFSERIKEMDNVLFMPGLIWSPTQAMTNHQ